MSERRGIVLAVRKVPPERLPALQALLAGGSPPAGENAFSEFILRMDDGATISIVQAEGSGLVPGRRVGIRAATPALVALTEIAAR